MKASEIISSTIGAPRKIEYSWPLYRAQLDNGRPPMNSQPSFVELWYDRHCRLWVHRVVDSDYRQLGECEWCHGCRGFAQAKANAEMTHGKLNFERI